MNVLYPEGLFLLQVRCPIHGAVYHEIAYSHCDGPDVVFTATCPHCRESKLKPYAWTMKLPILDWNYIISNLTDNEEEM